MTAVERDQEPLDGPESSDQAGDGCIDPEVVMEHLWVPAGPRSFCLNREPWVGARTDGFEYDRHVWSSKDMLQAADQVYGEADAWWGIAATPAAAGRGGSRGGRDDVESAQVIYCELDWDGPNHKSDELPTEEEVRAAVDRFSITPTAVVESGGGLHLYWRLAEPVGLERFERLEEMMELAFEADGVHVEGTDAARVLRVLGSVNRKNGVVVRCIRFTPRDGKGIPADVIEHRYGKLLERQEEELQKTVFDLLLDGKPGSGPITDYNRSHRIEDELVASGWDRLRRGAWSRPGRPGGLSKSARVVGTDRGEVLMVYSTAPELEPLRRIALPTKNKSIQMATPFDLFAVREHGGDRDAAVDSLRPPEDATPKEMARAIDQRYAKHAPSELWLPDEFFDGIAALEWLRLATQGRASIEMVVGCAFLVVSSWLDVSVTVEGEPASSLNFAAAFIGPPGTWKSRGMDLAFGSLMPTTTVPIGSGPGMVRQLMEANPDYEEGSSDPSKQDKQRPHGRPVIFRSDEIHQYAATTRGDGSWMPESAWVGFFKQATVGGWIGETLKTDDLRDRAAPNTYRAEFAMAVQPNLAGVLFADVAGGTAQRIEYSNAVKSPSQVKARRIPLQELEPTRPFPELMKLAKELRGVFKWSDAAQQMKNQMEREHSEKANNGEIDALDAHRPVVWAKVAIFIAILDGRDQVEVDHCDRASMRMACSDATRDWTLDCLEWVKVKKERDRITGRKHSERAAAAEEEDKVRDVLDGIVAYLKELPAGSKVTRKQLRDRKHNWRPYLDDALELGVEEGIIHYETEPGQGQSRKAIWLA